MADDRALVPAASTALATVPPPGGAASALADAAADAEARLRDAAALEAKLKFITEHVPTVTRNVQGSTAGAGSSTFHIYRQARRREADRVRAMDAAEREDEAARAAAERRAALEAEDAARTAKRRAKRDKKKARKRGRAGDDKGGGSEGGEGAPAAPADDQD